MTYGATDLFYRAFVPSRSFSVKGLGECVRYDLPKVCKMACSYGRAILLSCRRSISYSAPRYMSRGNTFKSIFRIKSDYILST